MAMDLTDEEMRLHILEGRIERLQEGLEMLVLEIEGIQDTFESLPAEVVAPIKERCDSMMEILADYRE